MDLSDTDRATVGLGRAALALTERNMQLEAENERLREALRTAKSAIEHLEPEALGMATISPRGDDDFGHEYPIRDEIVAKITAALSEQEGK
jgi:hypothetical protein